MTTSLPITRWLSMQKLASLAELGGLSSAVRVLGPVEVVAAGSVLRVTPLQRALIAVLAAHHGRTVSTRRLVDALWAESRPSWARNRVQSVVSSLRKLVAADAALDDLILTGPAGYALRVDQGQLDVATFERLVGDGRRCAAAGNFPAAVRSLRRALALWRGRAFEGVDSSYVTAEATRLEELRLVATEDMVDAHLALGRPADLVADLAGLVADAPYRVRLRGQLMVALHSSGRQAEALEVYRSGDHLGAGRERQDVALACVGRPYRAGAPARCRPRATRPAGRSDFLAGPARRGPSGQLTLEVGDDDRIHQPGEGGP
jgi:DNA-binding SARP family transcriptional activator